MAGTGTAHLRPEGSALLRIEDLTVEFKVNAGTVQAVSGISMDVLPGETVGLVGESGCGKSTTGRVVMNLLPTASGSIKLDGVELSDMSARQMRPHRRRLQMIFQDPISSLNPRRRVRDIIAEPLRIAGDTDRQRERVDEMMEAVGLDPAVGDRRPHELSGGQCQRVSIARALILQPQLIICDEAVSALDVSVQAQILNLLEDLKDRYGLAYIFVTHDLAVVRNISDRVVVMYMGKICEVLPSGDLHHRSAHPYTRLLVDSIPSSESAAVSRTRRDAEQMPSPLDPPSGCRFRTRCPMAAPVCAEEEPILREIGPGQFAACHFAEATVDTGVGVADGGQG